MKSFLIAIAISAFLVKIDCREVVKTEIFEIVEETEDVVVQKDQTQTNCACQKNNLVSVAQWSKNNRNWFTASQSDMLQMGRVETTWSLDKSPGRASTNSRDCKGNEKGYKPVYRLFRNTGVLDWFTSANTDEISNLVAKQGYAYYETAPYKRIAFYGSDRSGHCGATVPLYRCMLNSASTYFTNDDDLKTCVAKGGQDQGVVVYLWPAEENILQ